MVAQGKCGRDGAESTAQEKPAKPATSSRSRASPLRNRSEQTHHHEAGGERACHGTRSEQADHHQAGVEQPTTQPVPSKPTTTKPVLSEPAAEPGPSKPTTKPVLSQPTTQPVPSKPTTTKPGVGKPTTTVPVPTKPGKPTVQETTEAGPGTTVPPTEKSTLTTEPAEDLEKAPVRRRERGRRRNDARPRAFQPTAPACGGCCTLAFTSSATRRPVLVLRDKGSPSGGSFIARLCGAP